MLAMIRIQTSLIWPGCAQGKYTAKAKGFILTVLRWGNVEAPLDDWSPFAYVPVDPAGNGIFSFSGKRGIPVDASHVWARCYTDDFGSFKDVSVEIPEKYKTRLEVNETVHHFSVLTDLHLAAKPWKIKQQRAIRFYSLAMPQMMVYLSSLMTLLLVFRRPYQQRCFSLCRVTTISHTRNLSEKMPTGRSLIFAFAISLVVDSNN